MCDTSNRDTRQSERFNAMSLADCIIKTQGESPAFSLLVCKGFQNDSQYVNDDDR